MPWVLCSLDVGSQQCGRIAVALGHVMQDGVGVAGFVRDTVVKAPAMSGPGPDPSLVDDRTIGQRLFDFLHFAQVHL